MIDPVAVLLDASARGVICPPGGACGLLFDCTGGSLRAMIVWPYWQPATMLRVALAGWRGLERIP